MQKGKGTLYTVNQQQNVPFSKNHQVPICAQHRCILVIGWRALQDVAQLRAKNNVSLVNWTEWFDKLPSALEVEPVTAGMANGYQNKLQES